MVAIPIFGSARLIAILIGTGGQNLKAKGSPAREGLSG